MKYLLYLFIFLFPVVACSPERSPGPGEVNITIPDEVVNPDFRGIGFHVFYHLHNAPQGHYEEIFAKRWRELNPSFARITDHQVWDKERKDKVSTYLEVMKDTDTELYFTTWDTRQINNYTSEAEYVRDEVDNLAYYKNEKGFDQLHYYCMSNELSVEQWASMVDDLDRFKRVHQLFYDELKARNLDIDLLATDASPFTNWPTIEWASRNMDEITGVYGGHHYINGYDLFDTGFYPFFLEKMKWGAGLAREKNKRFIVGEFGPKQNSNTIDSVRHDACIYNNTPLEKFVPIQVAEALIAMINGGVYAASYWTFSDFPSTYRSNYINKWGVFKWEVDDFTTRPSYYSIGLFTKFLRGPAEVLETVTMDSLVRICTVRNLKNGAVSIAVVNRNAGASVLDINLSGIMDEAAFRKYEYDPENVPFNYFGDLQPHIRKIDVNNGRFKDTIGPMTVTVYTMNYDEEPPAPVTGLDVQAVKLEGRDRNRIRWNHGREQDLCYYRIYRSVNEDFEISPENQIATTIKTEYIDRKVHGLPQYYYQVTAVDQSGNSSE